MIPGINDAAKISQNNHLVAAAWWQVISILQKATGDGANDFMVIPVGGRTGPGSPGPCVKMVTDLGKL